MNLKLLAIALATIGFALTSAAPGLASARCHWEDGRLTCEEANPGDRNGSGDSFDPDDWPQIEAEINHLYQEVLGRDADRDGLRTYTEKVVEDRWSLYQVRENLAYSREAQKAINRIYEEVLGRRADHRGMETYLTRLRDGWSLNRIRQDLADSSEAARRRRR